MVPLTSQHSTDWKRRLFNESLPLFLAEQDAAAPGGKLANLTYVHLDMDLYAGACFASLHILSH